MIDLHLKYDNMHKNGMFYALICINNHVITSINYMLLHTPSPQTWIISSPLAIYYRISLQGHFLIFNPTTKEVVYKDMIMLPHVDHSDLDLSLGWLL